MSDTPSELAWKKYTELRKEIVEAQKIRAQMVGFKITFVSASVGLIGANLGKVPIILLVIPAVASVFFDNLITSYSFSIKRTGFYCWKYLEPLLQADCTGLPSDFLFWEEYMRTPQA